MTARLRGSAQYERAAIGLAVHVIRSMLNEDVEGNVKHEYEQKEKAAEGSQSPRFYPSSFEDK